MTISEKVAYVKGLAEGLGVDKEEKTGKIISEMLAILSGVADKLDGVKDDCETLKQYVEEIDEDLEVLEDEVYGDGDCCCDDDCDCDDCCDDEYEDDDCGCGCGCEDDEDECDCCDGCIVTCPHCGVCLELEEDDDPDHLVCPNCKKEFSLDAEDAE